MIKYYNGEMYTIPKEFEEEIRADERQKFAEWLSSYPHIYIIEGYVWKKRVEVVECNVTVEDVLAEYEKEQKGDA